MEEVGMMSFKGKVAVVTGGGGGIGKCIAEEFKKQGAIVYVIDIKGTKSDSFFVGDIGDKDTLEKFAKAVINKNGKIDYLINAVSLSGKVRVNSISPGWIDTDYKTYEGPDAYQQSAGRVGNPLDIANMVLFLCSDKAGFITGENICIDGGMTKLMVYHGDYGWSLE